MVSCRSSKKITAAFRTYPTECISQNADGTLLLRVWAVAEHGGTAIVEAQKRALSDVIFNGINNGISNNSQVPLVIAGSARTKYEDYFLRFFASDGEWAKYVSYDKSHRSAMKRFKNQGTKTRGILVIVDRQALKARLKQDGIE